MNIHHSKVTSLSRNRRVVDSRSHGDKTAVLEIPKNRSKVNGTIVMVIVDLES